MIIDRVRHLQDYKGLNSNLDTAIEWVAKTDLASLTESKIDVDGENVYVMVQPYTTEPRTGRKFESHRTYADLQIVVKGKETLIYRSIEGLSPETVHDTAKDFTLYPLTEGTDLNLSAGEFAVFFPQDAHVPKIAWGEPIEVLKVVVKVKVE